MDMQAIRLTPSRRDPNRQTLEGGDEVTALKERNMFLPVKEHWSFVAGFVPAYSLH